MFFLIQIVCRAKEIGKRGEEDKEEEFGTQLFDQIYERYFVNVNNETINAGIKSLKNDIITVSKDLITKAKEKVKTLKDKKLDTEADKIQKLMKTIAELAEKLPNLKNTNKIKYEETKLMKAEIRLYVLLMK
jgi:hypothetical protein